MEEETRNINVTVSKEMHDALRIEAIRKDMEFHNYIRDILQKEVKPNARTKHI